MGWRELVYFIDENYFVIICFLLFPHYWLAETIWWQTTSRSRKRVLPVELETLVATTVERSVRSFTIRARKDCRRLAGADHTDET